MLLSPRTGAGQSRATREQALSACPTALQPSKHRARCAPCDCHRTGPSALSLSPTLHPLQTSQSGSVSSRTSGPRCRCWSGSATMWRRTSMMPAPSISPAATWTGMHSATAAGTRCASSSGPWGTSSMTACTRSVSVLMSSSSPGLAAQSVRLRIPHQPRTSCFPGTVHGCLGEVALGRLCRGMWGHRPGSGQGWTQVPVCTIPLHTE